MNIPTVVSAASLLSGTYFIINCSVTVGLNTNCCPGQRSFECKVPWS